MTRPCTCPWRFRRCFRATDHPGDLNYSAKNMYFHPRARLGVVTFVSETPMMVVLGQSASLQVGSSHEHRTGGKLSTVSCRVEGHHTYVHQLAQEPENWYLRTLMRSQLITSALSSMMNSDVRCARFADTCTSVEESVFSL